MWRGWHKLPGGDVTFDALANIPSSFPLSSAAGIIDLTATTGEKLFVIVVDDLLRVASCKSTIATAESKGFELALLNQGSGQQEKGVTLTSVRSGQRCIIDDIELAEMLWPLVQQHLPHRDIVPGMRYKGWVATGINSRFRVLKYSEGERFELHQDGSYYVQSESLTGEGICEQQSFVTFQLYLNDGGGVDFTGGATRFIQPAEGNCKSVVMPSPEIIDRQEFAKVHDVVPLAGRLLLFQHNCWHEGEKVTSGIKYVLRSEIMFSKI